MPPEVDEALAMAPSDGDSYRKSGSTIIYRSSQDQHMRRMTEADFEYDSVFFLVGDLGVDFRMFLGVNMPLHLPGFGSNTGYLGGSVEAREVADMLLYLP